MRKIIWVILGIASVFILIYHDIPNDVTPEDRAALKKFGQLSNTGHLEPVELAEVLIDQMQILIRKDYAIPKRQSREPGDLIRFRTGAGYDWSRTAMKFFKAKGIQCRQVSLYQYEGSLIGLFKPGLLSYPGVEIMAEGKWVFVDPIGNWVARKKDGSYGTVDELGDRSIKWENALDQDLYEFTKKAYRPVYGLYSRHGLFYPPYSPIPDFNFKEFKANF
jgi:hypothetical protein